VANDVVLAFVFFKNHTFFVFLAWDSISQPHGEGDFAIHYTIDTQLLGSLAPLFCFVYKCGYLRALTIYVWSEHSLWDFVVWLLLFLLFLLLFFFLFTGCWLESSVRGFSFFREVFVLFSFKFRSSFAPRRVASCPYLYNAWQVFLALRGITVRVEIRCGKRCGFGICFLQKSYIFCFFGMGFDLPTSWRGRFLYPLYY
jgi:hypothetical protein